MLLRVIQPLRALLLFALSLPAQALAQEPGPSFLSRGKVELGGSVLLVHDGPVRSENGVSIQEFGQRVVLALGARTVDSSAWAWTWG